MTDPAAARVVPRQTPPGAPGAVGERRPGDRSRTPGDDEAHRPDEGVGTAAAADVSPTTAVRRRHGHDRRTTRPVVAALLVAVLALVGTALLAGHLYRTTQAWEARADDYLTLSRSVGDDLATTRGELAGARSELEAVRAQLATAQERIVELADEKARLGDDREVQRQLVDYEGRVNEAAGRVALALDQCVQGQNQLIAYLQERGSYAPEELDRYGAEVQALCQAATDANAALQLELGE